MDYRKTAQEIYDHVGKKANIISAAHCATRLRLVIADNDKADKEYVENIDGVKGVFFAQGQMQIILGTGVVNKVYDEFIQIAPKDPNRHILRYQILRAQRAPIEQQIEALEEFKKAEYIEEWAYELAKLYREAGMMTECLEECDDLILWFSEGKYVYKAMELKMQYKPLSPSQQQKYDHRYEKLSSETEEIPDLTSYLGEDEEKDSASEGAEALGDTRSIGLTEQPVMENDSTSDVIDTDAVTLEAAEEK